VLVEAAHCILGVHLQGAAVLAALLLQQPEAAGQGLIALVTRPGPVLAVAARRRLRAYTVDG